MNGNGDGSENRIKVTGWDTTDSTCHFYTVLQNGSQLLPSKFFATVSGARWRFHYEWRGLPSDALAIGVVELSKGGGYWNPVRLPSYQSDEMIRRVEALLNLHGLSLMQGVPSTRRTGEDIGWGSAEYD